MMNKAKKIIVPILKKTGNFLIKEYDSFDRRNIKLKSYSQVVTRADIRSEKMIIGEIKKNFPDHKILSEEAGKINNKSDYLWIIDPIDGTTNFTMHNPLWSISVSLAYKNEIILGIIYAPILEEAYIAEKGRGAFLNNKSIRVSNIKSGKVLNTFCHGSKKTDVLRAIKYYSLQKQKYLDCRQMGSAAIELAYVACGRIESIAIPGANAWDVAAGVLLVREAGGKVTDFNNKKWSLNSKDMLASNALVHSELLKTLI